MDCANGAAYSVAPKIFRELEARSHVLHNVPDGLNINQNCGAMHPKILKKSVKYHNADIGVAFDGDADRVVFTNISASNQR